MGTLSRSWAKCWYTERPDWNRRGCLNYACPDLSIRIFPTRCPGHNAGNAGSLYWLGAWTYFQQGYVDVKAAVLICLGFVFGGLIGAQFAVDLPEQFLRRVFGTAMVLLGLKMVIQ